jgi:hypothetical protein
MKKNVNVSVKNPTTGEILHGEGHLGIKEDGVSVWEITLINGWKMSLSKDEALLWKLQTEG